MHDLIKDKVSFSQYFIIYIVQCIEIKCVHLKKLVSLIKNFQFLYLAFSGLIDVGVILCVATSVKLVDVSMRLTDAIITYKCGIACRYFHIALRNNIFSLYLWSDQRANIPLRLYSNLNFMFNLISITFDG